MTAPVNYRSKPLHILRNMLRLARQQFAAAKKSVDRAMAEKIVVDTRAELERRGEPESR